MHTVCMFFKNITIDIKCLQNKEIWDEDLKWHKWRQDFKVGLKMKPLSSHEHLSDRRHVVHKLLTTMSSTSLIRSAWWRQDHNNFGQFLEINSETSDPDIVDLQFEVVRLGRWEYGFSGFVDLKVDLYDNLTVRVTFERIKERAGPYSLLPMRMKNQTLSRAMNVLYKTFLQANVMKCCDNAPIVKEKFQPPLTKRFVTITNCTLSNDNAPSILMEGYYKMRMLFSGSVDVIVEDLSLIEITKIF